MTTIATNLPAASGWTISIGGGWIVLMLIGMGLCVVFMLVSMRTMSDRRGWAMCSRWPQETRLTDTHAGTTVRRPGRAASSHESEV